MRWPLPRTFIQKTTEKTLGDPFQTLLTDEGELHFSYRDKPWKLRLKEAIRRLKEARERLEGEKRKLKEPTPQEGENADPKLKWEHDSDSWPILKGAIPKELTNRTKKIAEEITFRHTKERAFQD